MYGLELDKLAPLVTDLPSDNSGLNKNIPLFGFLNSLIKIETMKTYTYLTTFAYQVHSGHFKGHLRELRRRKGGAKCMRCMRVNVSTDHEVFITVKRICDELLFSI